MNKSIELLKKINREKGKPKLWLRDDDILTDSSNFRLILKLAKYSFPLVFGVVPYRMKFSDLELNFISSLPDNIYFSTHGLNHANRSETNRPSEYPDTISKSKAKDEFEYGFNKVSKQFPNRFMPIFVPPWNIIDDCHLKSLYEVGFKTVSGAANVKVNVQNIDLEVLDTHLDILNYGSDIKHYPLKSDNELDELLYQVLKQWLKDDDATKPIGILSHHTGMIEEDINRYLLFIDKIAPYFDAYKIINK